jgi:hypothetical protein
MLLVEMGIGCVLVDTWLCRGQKRLVMSWYIRELIALWYISTGFSDVSWSCIKNDHEEVSLVVSWSQKRGRDENNNWVAYWTCTKLSSNTTMFLSGVKANSSGPNLRQSMKLCIDFLS